VDERSRELERRLELPLLIFALLTIPAIALEYADQQEPWHAIGIALNWSIWLALDSGRFPGIRAQTEALCPYQATLA